LQSGYRDKDDGEMHSIKRIREAGGPLEKRGAISNLTIAGTEIVRATPRPMVQSVYSGSMSWNLATAIPVAINAMPLSPTLSGMWPVRCMLAAVVPRNQAQTGSPKS
jgi:hypothetical protein